MDYRTYHHTLYFNNSMSLDVRWFGLQTVTIPGISFYGGGWADVSLDASNSGTINASDPLGFQFNLQNKSVNFAGAIFAGSLQITAAKAELVFTPEVVNNRNFDIDASSGGSLRLSEGNLTFTITGGAGYNGLMTTFGTNVFTFDISANPIVFDFTNLGSLVMSGTADDDQTGFDGLGEINMSLLGVSSADWLMPDFPTTFGITGNLYVSTVLPEFHTLGLCSLAVAGLGAYAAYRRRTPR